MSLQDKLDAYREGFVKKAPKDALEVMHRAQSDLQASGILEETIRVGDFAPDFNLKNTSNADAQLKAMMASGPVVLSFYRGRW